MEREGSETRLGKADQVREPSRDVLAAEAARRIDVAADVGGLLRISVGRGESASAARGKGECECESRGGVEREESDGVHAHAVGALERDALALVVVDVLGANDDVGGDALLDPVNQREDHVVLRVELRARQAAAEDVLALADTAKAELMLDKSAPGQAESGSDGGRGSSGRKRRSASYSLESAGTSVAMAVPWDCVSVMLSARCTLGRLGGGNGLVKRRYESFRSCGYPSALRTCS